MIVAACTIAGLGCTATLALAGWWGATRRGDALLARYHALLDESWWSAEAAVEYAGRCAFHGGGTRAVPPTVDPGFEANFLAGWDHEELMAAKAA